MFVLTSVLTRGPQGEIERDGDTIATVSKKWFRVRDTYGIKIREGEDESLCSPCGRLDAVTTR